ncbi:NEDD1 isoform X2 [Olea europaea subsp. europaea]|uniref:NEDD1 isoform X2 n=2 Tax=Olea europaea subsp. europaea TaxID=158383 RepID=A0A8S0P9W1_OLEEU|nr:NEDD1 isoform X2 [Olea europaea subsp. europaea]
MNSTESMKLLLAASGGDTVKLFDISLEPRDPCVLSYVPSPSFRVNSVKWNHNNLVVASAGDDKKISLRRKNGQGLWTVPAKTDSGESIEPQESISTISFSNKGSRYLCSGGTGQIVRIWDLQKKRCVKWLRGHTDTIAGALYNYKDEHIASISRKGDLILHNLASGTKAAELKDPNGQILGVLDYSRMSRHLLVTAGDDGSIHLWDTTGRSPKVSWLKQHSAPTSGISFSPLNDKIIASVGLDMKLYTFDSGSKKPSSCIPYEAPFSSLAFTDDGLTLAAGTTTGQIVFYDVRGKPQPITVLRAYGNSEAVSSLCWQRSKPVTVTVNERSCTDETVLLAGDVGDSFLMPDPLPSMTSLSLSTSTSVFGSRNPINSEETSVRSSSLTGGTLARLHASRSYNFKDDMEVFSPLVEVQPITPSLDKLWGDREGPKKDLDKKPSFLYPSSRRFALSEEVANDSHPIFDWKSNSTSKQDDMHSTLSQLTSTSASTYGDDSSITPPESWGGERFSDKLIHLRQSVNAPSRFSMLTSSSLSSGSMLSGSQDVNLPTSQSTSSLTSNMGLAKLRVRETSHQETLLATSEHLSPSLGTKGFTGKGNADSLSPAFSLHRRFSSYAERIGATPSFSDAAVGSPKTKKTGAETREELLNSLLSRSGMSSATEAGVVPTINGEIPQLQETSLQPDLQQGTSFTLQLFQHTLEETLASFQKSNHEDIRNLHIEILRQFHMQEMEMSSVMRLILKNQAEIMKEIQSLRNETQQLRQLL